MKRKKRERGGGGRGEWEEKEGREEEEKEESSKPAGWGKTIPHKGTCSRRPYSHIELDIFTEKAKVAAVFVHSSIFKNGSK